MIANVTNKKQFITSEAERKGDKIGENNILYYQCIYWLKKVCLLEANETDLEDCRVGCILLKLASGRLT